MDTQMVEDKELIRQYATNASEAAFAALVNRHLKMVYAAALRQVNGDFQLAEDVAQSVFADLARKAQSLQRHRSIAGWLYASTRFTAANAVRSEIRRRVREQEAAAMNDIQSNSIANWDELRPIIDEMLGTLGDADREAIVLRYFESLEFSLVGTALGISESGARMKVERALEKLRRLLQGRGLNPTSAALAGVLAESSVVAVPGHLAAGITSAALAQAAASSATSTILKVVVMKKFALVAAGVLVALAVVKVAHSGASANVKNSVKTVVGKARVTLTPGESLLTGGWAVQPGTREFVLLIPTWIDARGNKVQSPEGSPPQITIDAKFIEEPEQDFVKLGLKPYFVGASNSQVAVKYSASQFQSLMTFVEAKRADILSSPRMTTAAGVQCSLSSTDVQTIAGKAETLGSWVDLYPRVAADGISVDLDVTVRVAAAVPR